MRKLLITKRLTALLWALVLTLMPMNLMATVVDYGEPKIAVEQNSDGTYHFRCTSANNGQGISTIVLPVWFERNANLKLYIPFGIDKKGIARLDGFDTAAANVPCLFKGTIDITDFPGEGDPHGFEVGDGLTSMGTYDEMTLEAGAGYYLKGQKLVRATEPVKMNPYRAYFKISDGAQDLPDEISIEGFEVDDDEEDEVHLWDKDGICTICGSECNHSYQGDFCIVCGYEKNTPLSVNVKNQGGSFAGEQADNAFDGITTNKWCGGIQTQNNTNAFVQVRLAEKSKLDYYYLYTGNDINYENSEGKQQRNPKEWKLYAKVNTSDEWTLISHVTNAHLPTKTSTRSNNYKIDAVYQNIEYDYLKFEILQVEQGTIFEVGEICLINCAHEYAEGSSICSICSTPCSHLNHGEFIPAKEPTCTEAGNIAYGQCTDCHKYIDEEGNELVEGQWILPLAHTFDSDGICTKCGIKTSLLSFTIDGSVGGFIGERSDKAIDGITTNRWCGNFTGGNPYIVLKNDGKAKLVNYYLYTGNEIVIDGKNHNPKEWKLYAKEKASDEWTVISHVIDAQLPTEKSTQSNYYTITEDHQNTFYKFFKFEIISVEKGGLYGAIYEVGELCLMGCPCQHQYDDESVFCSICGDIKEHEHIYGDGIVTKEPTCIGSGEKMYTCSRCGETKTEKISPLGHDYNDYIVTEEPTCTEPGEKEHTCTRCKETETEEISPLGHTINDDLICTVCGHDVRVDCVIEYTATERLSTIWEGWEYDGEYGDEAEFDYTDKDPDPDFSNYENFGEWLFGAPAIKHEYDETTHKGRIICNAPVTKFEGFTSLHADRLISITLPSTVTEIGDWAFDNCSNLTSITYLAEYSEGLEYWSGLDGCNNLQEIIVPYNSYHKYVEMYLDEDDEEYEDYYGHIKALFKSLLTLDDTKTFETPESEVKVDATLQRSFANDGWYSLCVPFSVSVADSPFSQVAEFSELDGDTYKFTTVDAIEAGKAYIVKVDATVANPTFKNVFITTEAPAANGDFIGVYGPTVLGVGCKVIGSGTTVNPVNPGTMKAFRCYFKPSQAGAKTMYFSVDDGVATAIESSEFDTLPSPDDHRLSSYNLSGQKVDDSYRGIVVKNGKKYMNK